MTTQNAEFERFQTLAATHNVVPLVREVLADCDTPISVAERLATQGQYFLLESVEGGEKWGRFSILGFNISKTFAIEDGRAVLTANGQRDVMEGNPIDRLQDYLSRFSIPDVPGLPRFMGGAVGYLSFESVRFFERCGEVKANDSGFPEALFMITDHLAVFDNIEHTLKLICCVHIDEHDTLAAAFDYGRDELAAMETMVRTPAPHRQPAVAADCPSIDMTSNMSPEAYMDMVEKAKAYIRAGDIIQVVLAQHFSGEIQADYLDVYRALRYINPSPYLFFMRLDEERALAGSSPEVMVRVTGQRAELRPIAGTRPRSGDHAADQRLAEELMADPKERAEHVMLVDLARNDLGRVSDIGSVKVTDYMFIERYSHVMHLVSQVESQLSSQHDALDVLKASFPAGTLSGAPKVRAMEIINELEPTYRGPYGGAMGYIGYGGDVMDMAITIRTVLLSGNQATVTAGAGIVYDSVPEREFEETLHKSRGMKRALEMAEAGLRIGEPS